MVINKLESPLSALPEQRQTTDHDGGSFEDALKVAIWSIPITYGLLIFFNPSIFLSIDFFKLTAVSAVLMIFGVLLSRFVGSSAQVILMLVLSGLVVGFLDSIILTTGFFSLIGVLIIRNLMDQNRGKLSWTLNVRGFLGILVPALLLSLFSLSFVVTHVPEFFSESRSLGGDIDWLFQLLLAKNVANFGVVSTALNGTPLMQYHWLPYYLYTAISNISGTSLENVLTLFYATFVNPLIMVSVIQSARNMSSEINASKGVAYWFFAILLFGGVLSSGLIFGGFYIGPYASIGVLFLFLLVLAVTEKQTSNWVLMLIVLGIMLSKVPFGVMTVCLLGCLVAYDYWKSKKLNGTLLSVAVIGGLFFLLFWFWLTAPSGNGSPFYPGNTFELFHIRHMFENSEEITTLVATLRLDEYRLAGWLNIGIALISLYWPLALCLVWWRRYAPPTQRFLVASILTGVIGSISLSLTFFNGHHVYLAGYASILALPLIIVVATEFRTNKNMVFSRVILAVIVLTVGGIGFYSKLTLAINGIQAVKKIDLTGAEEYLFLQNIGKENEHLDFLVYVPPEHPFWKACSAAKAFQIPLLTNRPALRGLVYCRMNGHLWSSQNYYWWSYGYSAYSEEEFIRAQLLNSVQAVLCKEVVSKGFKGYFELQSDSSSNPVHCL